MEPLVISPGLEIPESELSFKAVRSSGKGGQNVNKVSTKIELRFDLEGSSAFDGDVRSRLRARCARYMAPDGALVVTSQRTRSAQANLEDARQKLAEILKAALTVPKKRRKTKPTAGSRTRRLQSKRLAGEKKRSRSVRADD